MTRERRFLYAALAAWLGVTVLAIASAPPLGHDESAFSVLARGGGPPTWMYRSSGVVLLARIGVALGGADWVMRLASGLAALGLPLATWAVARRAFGERTAAWAVGVICGAHWMALRSAELIGDVPATACLVAGLAVVVGELDPRERSEERAGPGWGLLAAAPAFAGAFYLRYGSAPVIAIAVVAAAALWGRALVRRPGPVLATAALFAALLVPHAVHALHATGKLLGVLEFSSHVPRRAYVGEGLVGYVATDPFYFYGVLVAPLAVAGLVAIVRPGARRRPTWFLGAVAIGQVLVIGLESHAEPRYVFVATVLLVVLGIELVRRALPPRPRLAAAAVGLAWLACAIAIVPYDHHLRDLRRPRVAAASAIRADAAGRPCLVVARVIPQLVWYSGCDGELLRDPALLPPLPADRIGYVASVPLGETAITPVAPALHATARPIATTSALAQVWRLDR